jgi:hypothetical protein
MTVGTGVQTLPVCLDIQALASPFFKIMVSEGGLFPKTVLHASKNLFFFTRLIKMFF